MIKNIYFSCLLLSCYFHFCCGFDLNCPEATIGSVKYYATNRDCKGMIFNEKVDKMCKNGASQSANETFTNVTDMYQCASFCQNTGKCTQFAYNEETKTCSKCLNANSNVYSDSKGVTVYDFDSDFSNYCPPTDFLGYDIDNNSPGILGIAKNGDSNVKVSNGNLFLSCGRYGNYEMASLSLFFKILYHERV